MIPRFHIGLTQYLASIWALNHSFRPKPSPIRKRLKKHSYNRSCIHMVSCRLSQTKAFPVKVCASEVQDISGQIVASRTCLHKIFSGKIVMLYPPFSPITPEKFGAQTSVRAAFQAFCSDGFLMHPLILLEFSFFVLNCSARPGREFSTVTSQVHSVCGRNKSSYV